MIKKVRKFHYFIFIFAFVATHTCDQSKEGRSTNVLIMMVVPSKTAIALGLQLWSIMDAPR